MQSPIQRVPARLYGGSSDALLDGISAFIDSVQTDRCTWQVCLILLYEGQLQRTVPFNAEVIASRPPAPGVVVALKPAQIQNKVVAELHFGNTIVAAVFDRSLVFKPSAFASVTQVTFKRPQVH